MILVHFHGDNSKIEIFEVPAKKESKNLTIKLDPEVVRENRMDTNRVAVLINQMLKRNGILPNGAMVVLSEPYVTEQKIGEIKRVFHMLGVSLANITNIPFGEVNPERLYQDYDERRKKEELGFIASVKNFLSPEESFKKYYTEPIVYQFEEYLFWSEDHSDKKTIEEMDSNTLSQLLRELENASMFTSCSFGTWYYERVSVNNEIGGSAEERNALSWFVNHELDSREITADETSNEEELAKTSDEASIVWKNVENVPFPNLSGNYLFTILRVRGSMSQRIAACGYLTESQDYLNGWQICMQDSEVYREMKEKRADGYDRIIAWAMMPAPYNYGKCE